MIRLEPLLRVEGLTTRIVMETGVIGAVEDVSLSIYAGEAVALVGESGCGKTMTALSLMRLVRPPGRIIEGSIMFNGQDLLAITEGEMRRLRGGVMAMIFQDPMTFLNPLMTVGDQIGEAIRLHQDLPNADVRSQILAILRRVHIPSPETVIDYYPHQLSGGMRQRVLIGMAISCRPSLMIADEPTTALDVTIQAQVMNLLSEVRRELGSAMLLITHDLGLVAETCDRVYVMYAGQIVEEADVFSLFENPKHPYTVALLMSTLTVKRRVSGFESITGQPPNLMQPPAGCRFHPRCSQVMARCRHESPPVVRVTETRLARCWLHVGN